MAISRYFLYPFGTDADDLTAIPDAAAVDGSVSYQDGWTPPYEYNLLTNPAALPIPRGQMNQLFYDVTLNIKQYQEYGNPEWVVGNTVEYPIYARVYYLGEVYENQVADNTNTPGTDATWYLISGGGSVPPGTVLDFAGSGSAPAGFILCDGSAVSRTIYSKLFAAISTTWGVGDGTTTFNVPDFRRRVSMGSGGTGTAVIANTVGSNGGEESTALTSANNGPHTHAAPSGSFLVNTGTAIQGGTDFGSLQANTASSGSGTPHNTIQPALIVQKIIRY